MSEQKEAITVAVSGAAGQICYSLIPLICGGDVFGKDQPVNINLLDIPYGMKSLGGVVMEIEDCSYPLVRKIVATSNYEEAFAGVDYAILVGGFPRGPGMLRKDLLAKNAPIFVGQGEALDKFARKGCRVCVVANPANTNALTVARNAPSIPNENITALTRLDMNRAQGILASKLGVSPPEVTGAIIWGNHSKTQVAYADAATVNGKSVRAELNDDAFIDGEFITKVQNRGAEVINARGKSSALSAANAIKDHVHDWHKGTEGDKFVCMSVDSTGNQYGIADGLMFSFPVTIKDRKWTIVNGMKFTPEQAKLVKLSETELCEERAEVSASKI